MARVHELRFLAFLSGFLLLAPLAVDARPLDQSRALAKIQSLNLSGSASDFVRSGSSGVFGVAGAGTTFYGGTIWAADSMRWEAMENALWTFDSGVGSSLVPPEGPGTLSAPTSSWVDPYKKPGLHSTMEGWVGFDETFRATPYFRRLGAGDPRWSPVCVGGASGLQGTYSFWAGVFPAEANALCHAAGQGYGNAWDVCIEHEFPYSGGSAVLSFLYKNDTEDGFDYTHVYCDTSGEGDRVEVASYTGVAAGIASIPLHPGTQLPISPRPIKIQFCVVSDGTWSDEDGLYPTTCGAFAVDEIALTGAIVHGANFETDDDGWVLSTPPKGLGGEWSNLYSLSDLPAPLIPCACALAETVIAFMDDHNQHNNYQDNLAASPWIDLKAYGKVGAVGKIITTNLYVHLPLINYVFLQFNAQWYPETCRETGKLVTSPWTSNGYVYYFGGTPQCTSTVPGTLGKQIDFSSVIPPGAEQVRIALGVVDYCHLIFECGYSNNSSPWLDDIGLGVYGSPDVPFIFADETDRAQDNFPANGTLNANAPGRIDCNKVQGASRPEKETTLGDTLVVHGALGNDEVYVNFKVTPGPGTNVANFFAWYNGQATSPLQAAFKRARMDTAEYGGVPVHGTWMTAYHELDPHFSGTDQDIDVTDPAPNGGLWRLKNDIFPDRLLTAGTRIDYFFSATDLGSGMTLTDPLGFPTASPYEMEILPSSFGADNTFNCVLYVDHFNRGAQPYIENALGSILGFGSENNENTKWDRYDVNAAASHQASFGRPIDTEYGASTIQALGYRDILWDSGSLNAFNLTKEDADLLIPWLTFLAFDFNNLYLSGDGIVFSAISEQASAPSARRLIQDLAGVTIRTTCSTGTFRDADCPNGAPQDVTPCVNLVPMPRAIVADSGPGRSIGHVGQGNGCPELRSFDVLEILDPDYGVTTSDEFYATSIKSARDASVVTNASSSGILHYKIVVDGLSVHYRRDEGAPCDFSLGGATAVTERLHEVLRYFGVVAKPGASVTETAVGGPCYGDRVAVGLPDEVSELKHQVALADFSPNPFIVGSMGRIRFTMAQDGRATLEIFDLQGCLVKSLFDGLAKEGENETIWDGTDKSGGQVSNGVYFYRLRALQQDVSKKLVVVGKGR